ncbi:MAG: hypothetical protein H0X28_01665 [Solirubrobacterales bacterium]|nr:hypothetical protein [Solirubrobacterales bacterium]
MLAYIFWHSPREPRASEEYEQALIAFHRSLARSAPVGMSASAVFRGGALPWLAPGTREQARAAASYEDWYLLEDFAALGVLNEAAVGRGHVTRHDAAARGYGTGAGALYGLIEGEPCAASFGEATLAVWVTRPPGSPGRGLGELLGDGMQPAHASLWRRHLVLGPAPEFCMLAGESPQGVSPARLPEGWEATALAREVLWSG